MSESCTLTRAHGSYRRAHLLNFYAVVKVVQNSGERSRDERFELRAYYAHDIDFPREVLTTGRTVKHAVNKMVRKLGLD